MSENLSMAFDLIVRYAEREGWIPIGVRAFTIGPWTIHVNGSKETVGHTLPWHATITNDKYLGAMMVNPYGGSLLGSQRFEDDFIRDMTVALGTTVDAAVPS